MPYVVCPSTPLVFVVSFFSLSRTIWIFVCIVLLSVFVSDTHTHAHTSTLSVVLPFFWPVSFGGRLLITYSSQLLDCNWIIASSSFQDAYSSSTPRFLSLQDLLTKLGTVRILVVLIQLDGCLDQPWDLWMAVAVTRLPRGACEGLLFLAWGFLEFCELCSASVRSVLLSTMRLCLYFDFSRNGDFCDCYVLRLMMLPLSLSRSVYSCYRAVCDDYSSLGYPQASLPLTRKYCIPNVYADHRDGVDLLITHARLVFRGCLLWSSSFWLLVILASGF
jgi:hypothetical protein